MKFEDFHSGKWVRQYQYRSFSPTTINRQWLWEDARVNTLLAEAARVLAELDAFTLIVPDVDLFIRMHITKEANNSSRIEGTQTEIGDAVMDVDQLAPQKRDDWVEVNNYIQAMSQAILKLRDMPLSNRLLREAHAVLMQGVRGEHKNPGEFRTSQNWIGGSSITDAVFVPPHYAEIADLMGDLEAFWHNPKIHVPELIRIAISHYQFETIHPFLDGNGRIGRLLITLYLVDKKLLRKPSLYLSEFFARHRGQYYNALTGVRESNDIGHWVRFFLSAVIEIGSNGKQLFENILELRNRVDEVILGYGKRAENAQRLMKQLYQRPAISINQAAKMLKTSHPTAAALLHRLVEDRLLKEITGYKRNKSFLFKSYLDLFEDYHYQ